MIQNEAEKSAASAADTGPRGLTPKQIRWAWTYCFPVAFVRGFAVALAVFLIATYPERWFHAEGLPGHLALIIFPISFAHTASEHAPSNKRRVALFSALCVALVYSAFWCYMLAIGTQKITQVGVLLFPLLGCFYGYKRAVKKIVQKENVGTVAGW